MRNARSNPLDLSDPLEARRLVSSLQEELAQARAREAEQRRRAERLARIIDTSNDMICMVGADGTFREVSAACERILGYRPAELVGRPYMDFVVPEDRDRTTRAGELIAAGQPASDFRNRYVRRDGAIAHLTWSARWSEEERSIIGVARDTTEQKEAQERLREQAHLLDGARDAIHVRDLAHRVAYWNRSAERLYGWPASDIGTMRLDEALHVDPSVFSTATQHLLTHGEWTGELELAARDGRRISVESRWTLLKDGQEKPHRILAIDTDVTERRQLERQLVRSQRLDSLGTLAGGIAHDLNNVFTPILMSTDLLALEDGSDGERAELLTAIRMSARRGADMVNQLLTFSRGRDVRFSPIDPSLPLRDLRRIVLETFPKNIAYRGDADPHLWAVSGDPTQLHQVLLNLCVNARDAMPGGGTLSVVARNETIGESDARAGPESPPGPYVLIEVTDTGAGISREVMDRIFDPFFTTKPLGKGTGLGLPTTLSIVKRHRGFMTVDSEPGAGTTIRVFIPALPAMRVADSGPALASVPRGADQTVLVVDDEAAIRLLAERTLREHGYQVVCASDGAEAVALYAKLAGSVDVVLMDMMMPVMDGITAAQSMRAIAPGARIVPTTGIVDDEHTQRIAAAGLGRILPKPYNGHALLGAISTALARSPRA